MMTVWPTRPLGTICDVQIGKTPKRSEPRYWSGDNPWLSIKDMNQGRDLLTTAEGITDEAVDEQNCRLVEPGTVLLSFKLSIGKVGIAHRPMYTNEAIAQLPLTASDVDRDFLYWALRTVPLAADADRAAMGATLNKAKLKRIPIPVPPIEEQRRVAAVLDAADALRAKRREALDRLDTLTQAIFIDMFGGSEWPTVRLGDVIATTSGGTPSRSRADFFTGDIPWVKSGEVAQGVITCTEERITEEAIAKSSAKLVPPGTVLLAMYGATVGSVGVLGVEAATNQAVCCLTPTDEFTGPYLLGLLRSMKRELVAKGAGGAQSNISQTIIRDLQVPMPPVSVQDDYAARVDAAAGQVAQTERSASMMDELFASLQQRAFRGEL